MKQIIYFIFLSTIAVNAQCTVPAIPNAGINFWNVLVYDAGDANGGGNSWNPTFFKGFYTESQLNFDTRIGQPNSTARSWNTSASPSTASGYNGCPTSSSDNFSYSYKRTGVPVCGSYSVDIPAHDDTVLLLINNVEVWRNIGTGTNSAIWIGYLDSNSTIEIKCAEGTGGALLAATFTLITTSATVSSIPFSGDLGGIINITNVNGGYCNILSTTFDSTPAGTAVSGNGNISGSQCILTTNGNSQNGSCKINPTLKPNSFEVEYNQFIGGGGGADGMSFSYGDVTGTGGGEDGWKSTGLSISFATYQSRRILVYYKGMQIGTTNTSYDFRANSYIPVIIKVNSEGKLTLQMNGNVIYSNLQLPAAYMTDSKIAWNFAFAARTGTTNDNHKIDDLRISAQANLEYSVDQAVWQLGTSFPGLAAGNYTVYARPLCGSNSTCNKLLGPVTIGSFLPPGNALNFDGVNDYVTTPNLVTNPTTFTIEAWFRTTNTSGGGIVGFNSEQLNTTIGSYDKFIYMNSAGKVLFGVNNGANQIITSPLSYNDGYYHHVAATFSSAGMKLYINGVIVGTNPTNSTSSYNGYWKIGGMRTWNNSNGDYFKGTIDEVKIWNTERTLLQIQSAMYEEISRATMPNNLASYYRFNADSGTTLIDFSNFSNEGILKNFAFSGAISNWTESYAMVVPKIPTSTAVNSGGFTANWIPPAVGIVNNYVIDISISPIFTSFIAGFNGKNVGTANSYIVAGLLPNTVYYWRVRANKTTMTNQGGYNTQNVTTTKEPILVTSTTSVSDFNLLTNTAIIVDSNITVNYSQNIPGFNVSISNGKQDGDVLAFAGTLPSGITVAAYNDTTGVLTFTGSASAADWQAILRNVTFRGYRNGTGSRGISFSAGAFNSFSNGHFYEYVPANNMSWTNAKTAAAARVYLNYNGYLATVTSQAENDYIQQILSADAWMGASDELSQINSATGTTTYANQTSSEGKWYWVTGPEAGTQFMTANGTTNVVAGKYANWATGEPNNSSSNEHYGQFYSTNSAKWNDLKNDNAIAGYLVEYGGLSTDIVQTPSYSLTMSVSATEPGNALNFDGSNDTVYVSQIVPNPTSFTLEAWFKTTSLSGGIVGLNAQVTDNPTSFDRLIYLSGGKVTFGIYNGVVNYLTTAENYNDGKYHHVAASFSATTGMKLYLDGKLVASNTVSTVTAYNGYWRIGGFKTWSAGVNNPLDYFTGSIDEVKIWATVRTLAEIQSDLRIPSLSNSIFENIGLNYYYSFNQGIPFGNNLGLTTVYNQTIANRNALANNFTLSGATSNWVSSYAMVVPTTTAATNVYSLGFTANWSASTVGTATKYYLDVSSNAAFTAFVPGYNNFALANVLTTNITGLNFGTTYYYRVRASNDSDDNAVYSNVTTVTTGPKQTLVAKPATNNNSVSFVANWIAPAIHNISAYLLDVSINSDFFPNLSGYDGLVVNGLSQLVSGLSSNTTYYYRVKVANYNDSNFISTNTNAPFGAIAININSVCVNGVAPVVTFTGSGSSVLPYTFNYALNGIAQPPLTTVNGNSSVTIAVPTGTIGTQTYTLISASDGSNGSNLQNGTAVVTVNALPIPSIIAEPTNDICSNTEVLYNTDSNQSNYLWTVPGNLGTDYTVSSGSLGQNSSFVTLKWLTSGSRTIGISYSNVSGCAPQNPGFISTTVLQTPVIADINGITTTTVGLSSTLSNATTNGVWSSSNTAVATVSTSGVVTALGVGSATIFYTITSGNCTNETSTVFTVNAAPVPTITNVSPTTATAGTTVTVTGTNFIGVSTLTINGQQVVFTVLSSASITFTITTETSGPVIISTPGGTATSATLTITTQAMPVITSFSPTSASTGQVVTITGTALSNASVVTFGGVNCLTYTVNSDTTITAVVGYGSSGVVSVTTPGGTANLAGFIFKEMYRSFQTGNFSALSTWEYSTNGNTWSTPTQIPQSSHTVLIQNGHTVTQDVNYTIGLGSIFTIASGGAYIVNPTRILAIAGQAALGGNHITFKSDATGTGMLGQVSGTVTGATNASVEIFIPSGKRAYRFLTPGVNTTDFISANWQPAVHITGSTTMQNGFDVTATGNPSMYTYSNQVASGTGWAAIQNTNATNLIVGSGYRMLIRGDRTPSLITNASAPNMNSAVTLNATGSLVTGVVVLNAASVPAINNTTNSTTDGFSLVGNPYVSPIDWDLVGKSGLIDSYYGFEPNFGSGLVRGKYVAYSTATHTNNESASNIGQFIQSGQAFMVKNAVSGTSGTLTFNESNKVTNQVNVFRHATTDTEIPVTAILRLSVYDSNELALASYPIDGAVAVFGSEFSNNYGYGDVDKLMSSGENLGFLKDFKTLSIEALAPVQNQDELLIRTTQFQSNKSYTFRVNTQDFSSDVSAYLVDNYLNTESLLTMGELNYLPFSTTADANSYGSDRFKIIFTTSLLSNDYFEKLSMVIYPNPVTNNSFNIGLPSFVSGDVKITIYNLVGQEIYQVTEQAHGTITISPTKSLAEGVYIVQIINNGKVNNKKITVQ
ncbi:LamG-like jellyroll fold domain-containing protein [Flavobacterium sp.]